MECKVVCHCGKKCTLEVRESNPLWHGLYHSHGNGKGLIEHMWTDTNTWRQSK